MKILKILGIAAGIHAVALLLIFANPGCSSSNAAPSDASPISSAPADTNASAAPISAAPAADSATIRFSPTRPGTVAASALQAQPVSDVTPATTYTVGKGDSLWTIAKKNGISKADLAAANNLKTSAVLHVGQKLIIPSKALPASAPSSQAASAAPATSAPASTASASSATGEPIHHTVRPGETLGAIARKYGVKLGDIAVANNITDSKKIHPGQDLVIPARSSKASKGSKTKPESAEAPKAASTPVQAPAASNSDQDLDAGLKSSNPSDVPVIKIDDTSSSHPKSP